MSTVRTTKVLRSWTDGPYTLHEDDSPGFHGTTIWRHWSTQDHRCWACDDRPARTADRPRETL